MFSYPTPSDTSRPQDPNFATSFKTALNIPTGLKKGADVEPLIALVESLEGAGLTAHQMRLVFLQCLDPNIQKELTPFLKDKKVDLTQEKIVLAKYFQCVRLFFAISSPFPTLYSALLAPITISAPSDFYVKFDSFSRNYQNVKRAMDAPTAPLALFSHLLPASLQEAATSFILQNPTTTTSDFTEYLASLYAARQPASGSRPNYPVSVSVPAPVPSTSSPAPSSFPSDPFSEKECHYCHAKGHIKKDCEKKKAADARAVAVTPMYLSVSSRPDHQGPVLPDPEPLLHRSPKGPVSLSQPVATLPPHVKSPPNLRSKTRPYIGHPVLEARFKTATDLRYSYVLPDTGSPHQNLISPDLARYFEPLKDSPNLYCIDTTINGSVLRVTYELAETLQPPALISLNTMIEFNLKTDPATRSASLGSEVIPLVDYHSIKPSAYDFEPNPLVIPVLADYPENIWKWTRKAKTVPHV